MNDLYILIMAIIVAVVVLFLTLMIKKTLTPRTSAVAKDDHFVNEDLTVTLINQPAMAHPTLVSESDFK